MKQFLLIIRHGIIDPYFKLYFHLQVPVALVMSLVWQVFEPLLFGLVGAEVSVEYMNSKVVGELLQWNNLQAGC